VARAITIQTNLTGGELDPKLLARVDTQRYKNAVASCINAVVLASGGVTRRAGLRFTNDSGAVTVNPIEFNIFRADLSPPVVQGYLIEFRSDDTIHFYTNAARIGVVSIASPFTSDIDLIRYEQFDNVLYLFHPDFPPQQLTRTDDNTWVITPVVFTFPPVLDTETEQSVTSITRVSTTATVTMGAAHGYATGQTVRIAGANESDYNGDFQITVTSDTVFTYTVSGAPATPATGTITAQRIIGITRSGTTATVNTGQAHGFLTGHIAAIAGAVETDYNGDFQITVTSTTEFTYTVSGSPSTPATGTITAGRVFWGTTGYPNSGTFFEQRMVVGGVVTHPQTVFGSESGVILNFVTGTADSDPFEFVLAAATSRILHLAATTVIIVMTFDKEITIQGGVERPLTPTNFQIKVHTPYGSRTNVRPIIIAGEVIFVTKHGKKVRLLSDKIDSTTQKKAPDISLVSAHLSKLGIIDMAYQLEPDSVIWMVTSTGKLLSVTFDRETELLAWAPHTTDGLFKSVSVIPHNDTDEVWVAVERTINSITSTYIEVMDSDLQTDAAKTDSDSPAKVTWSGFDHLEGETVDIVADDVVIPQQVVSSGSITIPDAALAIEVGLHYKSTVIDLPPEVPTNLGTSQGQKISVNRAVARLFESIGLKINGVVIPFRKFGQDNFDEKVQPFTGDKEVTLLGGQNGVVTFEQDQPLPFTLLGIIKEVSVNG
jgi:hypothetical protein